MINSTTILTKYSHNKTSNRGCYTISLTLRPLVTGVSKVAIQNCSLLVRSDLSVLSIKVIATSLRNPVRPTVLNWLKRNMPVYLLNLSQIFGCFLCSYFNLYLSTIYPTYCFQDKIYK